MKIEQRPVYIAFDGQEFAAEHECLAYERDRSGDRLVGLTAAQIDAQGELARRSVPRWF